MKINKEILLNVDIEEFYSVEAIKNRDVYVKMEDRPKEYNVYDLRDVFNEYL